MSVIIWLIWVLYGAAMELVLVCARERDKVHATESKKCNRDKHGILLCIFTFNISERWITYYVNIINSIDTNELEKIVS